MSLLFVSEAVKEKIVTRVSSSVSKSVGNATVNQQKQPPAKEQPVKNTSKAQPPPAAVVPKVATPSVAPKKTKTVVKKVVRPLKKNALSIEYLKGSKKVILI